MVQAKGLALQLWMQRFLREHNTEPAMPVGIGEVMLTEEYKKIMANANERVKILTS